MSEHNGNRFSVYDSQELSALGLIEELANYSYTVGEELKNKTDLHGDHKGSWQGLDRPTMSEEGLRTTVEKIVSVDLPNINSSLETKAKQTDLDNLALIKANKTDVFTMENMGQDIKEAMTGGSVAVVGQNTILNENIVDKEITSIKNSFITPNDFNFYNDVTSILDMSINTTTGTVTTPNTNVKTSDFISVKPNTSYTLNSGNSRPLGFYDNNKTFISANTIATTGGVYSFTTPTNCYYVRWTLSKDTTTGSFTETQLFNGEYYPYKKSSILIENLKLKDMSIDTSKTSFIKESKNLFDIAKCSTDLIITGASGTTGALAGYTTSDFIPVKKDVKVAISTRFRKLLAYSVSKNPITSSYIDANTSNYIFTPLQDGYIRISIYNSQINEIQVEYSETVSAYQKCGLETYKPLFLHENSVDENTLSESLKVKINSSGVNNLAGKKLMCFGDSICQGNGNDYIAYGELLRDKNAMTLYNYGIGGATIGENSNNNFITTQITKGVASGNIPDYILVEGGTNDISSGSNIDVGALSLDYNSSSFDKTTTIGALEWIFYTLKNSFPNSKIAFVSVHKMGSRGFESQTIRQNACVDVCKKWSIPVIDIFNKGNMNTFLTQYYQFTCPTEVAPLGDRTHPNTLGYEKFYIPLIEDVLNNI